MKRTKIRVMLWVSGPLGMGVLDALVKNPELAAKFEIVLVVTDNPPWGNTMKRIWGLFLQGHPNDSIGPVTDSATAVARICESLGIRLVKPEGLDKLGVTMMVREIEPDWWLLACCDFIVPFELLEMMNGQILNIHPVLAIPGWQDLERVPPQFCGAHAFSSAIAGVEAGMANGLICVLQQADLPVDCGLVFAKSHEILVELEPAHIPSGLGLPEIRRRKALQVEHLFHQARPLARAVVVESLPYLAGLTNVRPPGCLDRTRLLDAVNRGPRKREPRSSETPPEPDGSQEAALQGRETIA